MDLSKSTAFKHLHTLTDLGYLVQENDGYYLSNRFLGLGNRAQNRIPINEVRDIVRGLSETTGHATNFITEENGQGVYALWIGPEEGTVRGVTEGDVAPLHATAGGKAILSCYSSKEWTKLLSNGELKAYTDKTITDRQELGRALRQIRDHRVAYDREEFIEGVQCVASPITDGDGKPIGAVGVSGRVHYMSGKWLEEDVAGLVTSAAKTIEKRLLSP
jgi:DNA-binding IclR family transcriptional regulator